MPAPDFSAAREAIINSLQVSLPDYYIGDDPGEAIEMLPQKKFGNVFLMGPDIDISKATMPVKFVYDPVWALAFTARAEGDALLDRLLDDMLPEILDALQPPFQGYPFGLKGCSLAYVKSAKKRESDSTGLYWEVIMLMELEGV